MFEKENGTCTTPDDKKNPLSPTLTVNSKAKDDPSETCDKGPDNQEQQGLLDDDPEEQNEESDFDQYGPEDYYLDDPKPSRKETMEQFLSRNYRNLVHFLVEDWFLSAMLGIITAILSIFMDVIIEYMQHYRVHLYELASERSFTSGLATWIAFSTLLVAIASFYCYAFGKQAVGSGIPEVKVIIHGFALKNYLNFQTLIAKIVGLTLCLGAGMPIGKEGPFVHIGAIIATLLTKATEACQYNMFFSNEGRQMEMLSTGCAVGIACTFSAPAGAVLYGIESTSKYFAVKNYWRQFFATTCSAIIFRFAMSAIVPRHIAGTIMAYYQTTFPNEVFLIEEIPFFLILGVLYGLLGASFVFVHRRIAMFRRRNPGYVKIFGTRPVAFTVLMAFFYAIVSCPEGLGKYFAGQYTFRETLVDFLANCTFSASDNATNACPSEILSHWSHNASDFHPLSSLSVYFVFYFFVVALFVSLYWPAGIFVPCFVIGACGGRIFGEILTAFWPEGFRGADGPQIYPGLYAVVGAAAFTGSVTHSLSLAVIVCETTGQLCALLPVLIALMVANAISSFLQPSVYESIIKIQGYPYLADLPPSRISVHTMKVDRVMVRDIVFITKETTYRELREILLETPSLRSYPFVSDRKSMALLGSVGRRYLIYLLEKKLGPDPVNLSRSGRRSRRASEIFNVVAPFRRGSSFTNATHALNNHQVLTDRQISGNTLLAHSPLHEDRGSRGPLAGLLYSQNEQTNSVPTLARRSEILASKLDLDDVAIDPAPFQLVRGTSLYKVHTLFSLLALNHAYVTERGRLVGVVALKELREAFNNIYSRGAVPINPRVRTTSVFHQANGEASGDQEVQTTNSGNDLVSIAVPTAHRHSQ
ncbi:unnamed protein product [Auanema sp. JU1783]|nr:unnamed protein product [Auanema sp. JU1783]